MARTPRSVSADPSLRHRLRWHATQSLRRGIACSILILQPLGPEDERAVRTRAGAASDAEGAISPLGQVTARLRPLLRRTDVVEVEEGVAIGVLLPGADADGVRAVHQRLIHAFDQCAQTNATGAAVGTLRLAMGYASAAVVEGASIPAVAREMVSIASVPRLMLVLSISATRFPRAVTEEDSASTLPAGESRPERRAGTRHRLRLLPPEIGVGAAVEARETLRQHADTLGVPYVALPTHVSHGLRCIINAPLARELRAVPIGRTRGVLTVAMQNPGDIAAMQRLAAATGLTIFPVLAAADELDRALAELAPDGEPVWARPS
jgi:hypothetical protein